MKLTKNMKISVFLPFLQLSLCGSNCKALQIFDYNFYHFEISIEISELLKKFEHIF